MKWMMMSFLLGLGVLGAHAQQEETVLDLTWDSPYALKVPNSEITHPDQGPSVLQVQFPSTYLGDRNLTLFRIKEPKIKASHYAIIGEVAYQNSGQQSYLEMMTYRLSTSTTGGVDGGSTVRTSEFTGPQGRLVGTSDFRPFILPIKSSNEGTQILEIDLTLSMYPGNTPESFSLRNIKLVEYPDPPTPTPTPTPVPAVVAPSNPPTQVAPTQPTSAIEWKSFGLGACAALASLLVLGAVGFLIRRIHRSRHERELRRIAAQDT